MTPNDPARYARELQGDFSEIDTFIRIERIKAICAPGFCALMVVLWFVLP